MIGLDTNILVALLIESQAEHARARQWLMNNREPLATTGTNVAEFLRLLSHPRVFPSPLRLTAAIELVANFLEQFDVRVIEESEEWWMELKELARALPSLRGNEVFDARIALCLRYNGVREICTQDADFSKYPFLKLIHI